MELFHLLDTYWGLQACPPSTVSPRLTSASLCRLPHGPILLPLILLNAATGCVDGRLHGVLGGGEQLEPLPPTTPRTVLPRQWPITAPLARAAP